MIELAIVLMLIGILMTIGTTALLRARMAGNESAAIANMQTINNGQFAYLAGCGRGYYATSLEILGTPTVGKGDGYISPSLADSAVLTGYRFAIGESTGGAAGPQDCNNAVTQTKYYASAIPAAPGSSDDRSFATNHNGTIWALQGGTPPAEPFGPPAVHAR